MRHSAPRAEDRPVRSAATECVPDVRSARRKTWRANCDQSDSHAISPHRLAQLMGERTEIGDGLFGLLRAGCGLLGRDPDIPKCLRHLLETDLLLRASCHNLLEGADALLQVLRKAADGLVR